MKPLIEAASPGVLAWWAVLGAISVVNMVLWGLAARRLARARAAMRPGLLAARRWQLGLSAVFVVGCAFRSFLPRVEGMRTCLVDSWISNAMIGRAVATVAELCFVTQWALLFREIFPVRPAVWAVLWRF